jgi:hypothetical protein
MWTSKQVPLSNDRKSALTRCKFDAIFTQLIGLTKLREFAPPVALHNFLHLFAPH